MPATNRRPPSTETSSRMRSTLRACGTCMRSVWRHTGSGPTTSWTAIRLSVGATTLYDSKSSMSMPCSAPCELFWSSGGRRRPRVAGFGSCWVWFGWGFKMFDGFGYCFCNKGYCLLGRLTCMRLAWSLGCIVDKSKTHHWVVNAMKHCYYELHMKLLLNVSKTENLTPNPRQCN